MATWADIQKYWPEWETARNEWGGESTIPAQKAVNVPGVGDVIYVVDDQGNSNATLPGVGGLTPGPGGSIQVTKHAPTDRGSFLGGAISDVLSDPKMWAVLGGGLAANAGAFGNLGTGATATPVGPGSTASLGADAGLGEGTNFFEGMSPATTAASQGLGTPAGFTPAPAGYDAATGFVPSTYGSEAGIAAGQTGWVPEAGFGFTPAPAGYDPSIGFTPSPYGSAAGIAAGQIGPGTTSSLAAAAGAKSLADLSKPISEWGADDWLSALGRAAPGLIGAYASSEQGSALSDLATQQMDAETARYNDLVARETERFNELKTREDEAIARQRGDIEYGRTQTQPYRTKLSALYDNPDSFLTSNEVTKPVQMGTDTLARSLSIGGNPAGSGNALQQLQSYSADQLFSRLGEEKNRLGTLGGMGSFGQSGATVPGIGSSLPGSATAGSNIGYTAGSNTSLASLGSDANIWNSLGSAVSNVFTPQKSLAQQLAELKQAGVF